MKIFLLFYVLIISYSFSYSQVHGATNPLFKALILQRKEDTIILRTTLTNNSGDTLRYLTMSCEWQIIYFINPDVFSFIPEDCLKNIPTINIVLPHASEEKLIYLLKDKNVNGLLQPNFRVGFNYIKVEKNENVFMEHEKFKDVKNILWSNDLLTH